MPSFFDDSDDDAVVQVREAKHSRRGHGAKSKNSGDVAVGDDAGIITIGQSRVLAPTLPELLRKQASAHPHRVFLKLWSSEGLPTVSLTFREFYAEAKAAAKILHSNGIQRAARIAFYGENSLEYLKFSFGCMLLGAIPVNLNWRQPASVLAGCFSLANCSFLLCSEHYRKDGLFVAKENECESKVLFLEYLGRADASALPEPPPAHNDSTDDMAVIFFTSGSTKTPKGVPHTHGELLWLCENYLQVLDNGSVPEDAGSLCLFPFFHVMGFVHNMLYNLYAGMFAVIHRETATAKITADLMLRACDELRPTYINTVPWIVEAFCSKLEKGDDDVKALACVEYFSYGGAALPDYCVPILERHGLSVMMSYGQTELAAAIMFTRRGGSLLGMRVFPGVEYELIDDQGDPCEPGNRQGELVLYNNHSSTLAYLPGSNARALAPPNMDTHQCYYTSDVFKEIPCPLDGEPLLVYCCRNDDLIVHKTGEMTHPIPSEQKILMECSDILKNVCMFGQGRSASLLAVELEKGTDLTPEIGHRLWDAIEKANQLQPSYSAISHQAVLIMDPSKGHPTLPTTAKGNVQRNRVEKIFAAELKEGEGTCDPELATLLIDCLSSDTLNALEEEEWDSLSLTSSRNGTSDPFLLKQFHAYFFALFGIVFIHLSNIGAASQYAPFLSAASVSPVWLAGLPRGFQLFALPVFLILMGIGDLPKFGGPNAGEKLSFSDFRKQVGLPFVLYLVCKYVLPVVAGAFLHPGYAIGGGHKTFPWVFLFMTYVRLLSFLAAKFRLPPIARAFLSIVLHFACFGLGYCPSPFSRMSQTVGPLPAALNCPRLSVYLPYYWAAPLVITKAAVVSNMLNRPLVKATAGVVLLAMFLWATAAFNLDTSMMGNFPYGCTANKVQDCPPSKWTFAAFAQDATHLVLGAVAVFCIMIVAPSRRTLISDFGQRSFICLLVHLYAIFFLADPFRALCRAAHKSPVLPGVAPVVVALALTFAVQVVCSLPTEYDATTKRTRLSWNFTTIMSALAVLLLCKSYVAQIATFGLEAGGPVGVAGNGMGPPTGFQHQAIAGGNAAPNVGLPQYGGAQFNMFPQQQQSQSNQGPPRGGFGQGRGQQQQQQPQRGAPNGGTQQGGRGPPSGGSFSGLGGGAPPGQGRNGAGASGGGGQPGQQGRNRANMGSDGDVGANFLRAHARQHGRNQGANGPASSA